MTEGINPIPEKQTEIPKEEITYLSGMYREWFLDYASYVILERAVPYVIDGLKPVQRRIMHAMKEMDDGRFNKVANIIGQTMQYHPHGDASIGDALVQLGQKELLVETQGNWGNILTGDGAAAPRYIEARLSKFALEVLFNPKTTEWKLSYDGRKKEPVTLPAKFPLLLAQGVEGIAVGLASKIFPHNFLELCDASVAYLKNEPFILYPDFPTGGSVDVSKYNDGLRGGVVKVRAKIEKRDSKTLVIKEIPYGKTTTTVIESILKANEKGKIKIRKIDDNTAANVEILVHLPPGVSSDKTIDALFAFSDCEVSISPNACIIEEDKPHFLTVSEILKKSVDATLQLLKLELEIRMNELQEAWHFASLEKIFIEKRIYKDKDFEQAENLDMAVAHVDKRLDPFKAKFRREITREDILKLLEIRMARILKFNADKAADYLLSLEEEMAKVLENIRNIIPFTIDWFERLKSKYGNGKERRTELRSFENIVAAKVVVANEKLYIDREEGFAGTGLKKHEYVCDCSDMDDIIIFRRDGSYFVTKVSDKAFIGKNVIYIAVFRKDDSRTIFNVVYRDGKSGFSYMKRFNVTGVTRDKEYDVTMGNKGSRVMYFSANPNGEAEILKVFLKPKARIKKLVFEQDMGELTIKGRQSMGNILTKHEVYKIALHERGISTLGGLKVWFDPDVLRLNADKRGKYLGEFTGDDKILVIYKSGEYQLYSYDFNIHFETNILTIEKYDPGKVLSVVYFDAEQEYYYVKRFEIEETMNRLIGFIGENKENKLVSVTWVRYPRLEIEFGGKNSSRENEIIEVAEFIGIKSWKAKGKRLSNYQVENIRELEPVVKDEHDAPAEEEEISEKPEVDPDDIPFEIRRPGDPDANQMTLF
ncbi:MAG: DNA gyrase/topoisomerase IV subunit A [Bacteroidota bacterium]|jgi:topoisomerase-4 subunit A|nr:DNA gyrase/topoisomerase IV subunit A [Prolixibacteraceae bacterium]MDI9564314.1 DNA gyrase/topoisomerase IV subunit A [Bacteroidota bacterium]NLS99238.1 DNA gyrase/topoisomerase IV subunit A [Bacteroidales bacterium]OQB79666.1 MAG: DNA gyrase subunit A [Bacteroidetes bacterium ADurb.Bin123]HNZ68004.1 DNA gyrase/topoisomerase IV subunit A [Prolixibacteraceae bacterium]